MAGRTLSVTWRHKDQHLEWLNTSKSLLLCICCLFGQAQQLIQHVSQLRMLTSYTPGYCSRNRASRLADSVLRWTKFLCCCLSRSKLTNLVLILGTWTLGLMVTTVMCLAVYIGGTPYSQLPLFFSMRKESHEHRSVARSYLWGCNSPL